MSYQYGKFIYGFPCPEGVRSFFRAPWECGLTEARCEELMTEWDDADEPFGFKFLYSASGSSRDYGYLGVEFDRRNGGEDLDCWSPFRPKDLAAKTPQPSAERMRTVQGMVLNLPEEIRGLMPPTPDVWIVWGSS